MSRECACGAPLPRFTVLNQCHSCMLAFGMPLPPECAHPIDTKRSDGTVYCLDCDAVIERLCVKCKKLITKPVLDKDEPERCDTCGDY